MCDQCGCGKPDHHHHEDSDSRKISIEQSVLAQNRSQSDSIRKQLLQTDSRLVNIIGSPGCGKTELLVSLLPALTEQIPCAIIEGDLATENDADRIRVTGTPVFQVQTGASCHLSAHDIEHGLDHLSIDQKSLVLVENVGNLVCPSMFAIGESLRIVCLSVTEGTDKPQKYPVSFREASLAIISKVDLLPYVDFDLAACKKMIQDIKPGMPVIETSAKTGQGLAELTKALLGLWDSK